MFKKIETMKECKKLLKTTYDIFEDMDRQGFSSGTSKPLQDVFMNEFLCVALYFAASDREVSSLEATFLNTLFDLHLTGEQYLEFCLEQNIYSSEFEDQELLCLTALHIYDKMTKKTDMCQRVLRIIKIISAELLKIDSLEEQEIEDFEMYFSKLEKKYR